MSLLPYGRGCAGSLHDARLHGQRDARGDLIQRVEQERAGHAPDLLILYLHGGERRVAGLAEQGVVEVDDRDFLRNSDSAAVQMPLNAESHHVVYGGDRRGAYRYGSCA